MILPGSAPRVRPTHTVTKFEVDCYIKTDPDAVQRMVNDPDNHMVLRGESDDSTLAPVNNRRSFVDDTCFDEQSFDDCSATFI